MENGRHIICGYDVIVENGNIVKAFSGDGKLYRIDRKTKDYYEYGFPINAYTFRNGNKDGLYIIR